MTIREADCGEWMVKYQVETLATVVHTFFVTAYQFMTRLSWKVSRVDRLKCP